MTSRLTFSEKSHTYALDGKRVPGVTTIIRNATDKPALPPAAAKETALWAAINTESLAGMGPDQWVRSASAAYRDVWNASAKRGTLLHEAARQLVRGDPLQPADPETGEVWPDDVIRSAEQLAKFMDQWDAQPVLAERPVFHDAHHWAGTVDLVADLRDGRRWLLDYKTGKGVYPETSVQLAAYRHASHVQVLTDGEPEDRAMPRVDRAGVVWVRPDGYELRPVRADITVYQVFLRMIDVSRWAGWKREDSVGEPLPVPEGAAS